MPTISCALRNPLRPLAFILDARTGLCIFTYAQCMDRKELKAVIKQLTSITFKFSVLWVLVIDDEEETRKMKARGRTTKAMQTST